MMRAGRSGVCALLSAASGVVNSALITLVRAYRLLLSPWLGSACRFSPTWSQYALVALERHGPATGSYLAARRLLRCHPGCPGGLDPVPDAAPRLFSRFCNPSSDSPRS
jgi:putative membrane protein insertion efficiency factor